eukprot:1396515-Prymnesium_polylepis.2
MSAQAREQRAAAKRLHERAALPKTAQGHTDSGTYGDVTPARPRALEHPQKMAAARSRSAPARKATQS